MAIAVVNKKQTAGAAAHPTLPITAATTGNLLVMFIAQTGSVAAPTSAGFTVDAAEGHHAIGNTSSGSLWLATKVAAGGETELVVTPAAGGAIQGISYFELSGASTTIDAIVKVDNPGSVKTLASGGLTTTDAGDVILGAVGMVIGFPSGTISAWTGTGPMTNVETTTTRCIGGSYIPGTTLSGVTFTANWETARQVAMLVVALKPAGGESFSGTLLGKLGITGAIQGAKAATSALAGKLGLTGSTIAYKTAGASQTGKLAITTILLGNIGGEAFSGTLLGQLAVTGGLTGRKAAHGEILEPGFILPFELPFTLGHAGRLAVTSTVTGRKAGLLTLTGRLALTGKPAGQKRTSATITGTIAIVGRLGTAEAEPKPCRIILSTRSAVTLTLSARPAVSIRLSARPAVQISLEAR